MKTVLLTLVIFCAGCSEKTGLAKHFERPVIVTDEAGNKFTIQHHVGATFIVEPHLEPQKLEASQ